MSILSTFPDKPTHNWPRWVYLVATLAAGLHHAGCSSEPEIESAGADASLSAKIDFPPSARADDDSVNSIVERALQACVRNQYEEFRSLWLATDEPVKKRHYEQKWQPVRHIVVRKVQPMRHAQDDSILYYVDVNLEFGRGSRKGERDIVFLVVKNNETWRLSRAPKSLVQKIAMEKTSGNGS